MRQTILKLSRALFRWPPLPASFEQKKILIARLARKKGIKNFIETGTFEGDMVEAQRGNFDKLVTIELDDRLYKAAKRRFENHAHIHVLQGDSGARLSEAIQLIEGPAIYWLDAHYSKGITARGNRETPILKELFVISARNQTDDTILIDDARLFGLRLGYPPLAVIRKFAEQTWPTRSFHIETDVICIAPP